MWLTKKKLEQLKQDCRAEAEKALEEDLIWHKNQVLNEVSSLAKDRKFIVESDEQKKIQDYVRTVARGFLIELAETPPPEFIEKIVQKINLVQLEK